MTKEVTASANRFRFRFWDTENKQMLAPQEDIAVTGNGKIIFDNGESAPYERYERVENWLPLQSTGLLDRNGKEIFEGDIVSGVEHDGVILSKCEVVFRDGCFCLGREGWPMILLNMTLEVTGNLYENPSILPI